MNHTTALARPPVDVFVNPALNDPSIVQSATRLLTIPGVSSEQYEQALNLLATVIYCKPDLIDAEAISSLEALFNDAHLPKEIYLRASQVLSFGLITSKASQTCDLLLKLLRRADLSPLAYKPLLDALEYTAFWSMAKLDLAALVALAEQAHLADIRKRLFDLVIERALLAHVEAITPALMQRLLDIYSDHRDLKYSLYYLVCQPTTDSEVRSLAETALAGRFALHHRIASTLGTGTKRVLVVQNIADKQGDEIIRLVPLLDAFLNVNPLLKVVLLTGREYLYAHSRIEPVPITDCVRTRAVLEQHFEAVLNFYEPTVPQVNYDLQLERHVQSYIETRAPFLWTTSAKGHNEFVYQQVTIDSQPYAEPLGLHQQRVENVYETSLRLLAELGLPIRFGETPPAADTVLASMPFDDAEAAWNALVEQNIECRPVALLCPFGGVEPLKGYTTGQADLLAKRLQHLIEEGFFVILLPNGMPWGSAAYASEVVGLLRYDHQQQVVIAPDPADGAGTRTYEHAGTHTVPSASYQMRLVTYFVRFADLIMTVEGWMAHAAYYLGKPYRVLMLPYSHQAAWFPYGRTLEQDVAPSLPLAAPLEPIATLPPPLPEQPRKEVLLALLRTLNRQKGNKELSFLRWAIRSQDRDIRLVATEALRAYQFAEIATDLRKLLQDPAYRVRSVAATALLEHAQHSFDSIQDISRETLLAHQWVGETPRKWAQVATLGEGARAALHIAAKDDDPVVSREAAQVLAFLDRLQEQTTAATDPNWRMALRKGLLALHRRIEPVFQRLSRASKPESARPTILILTPVKDAADCLDGYVRRIRKLSYPHSFISLGFLESDSSDTTFPDVQKHARSLRGDFRRVGVWKKDFGYTIPADTPRWAPAIQVQRRGILARSRNHLLFHALDDETWVLWMDVDLVEYPPDLIERLLAVGKDIVQPHCVLEYGGATFDRNAWRDHGRLHLDDLRGEGELVELHAVGGTVLFVRADLHRDGLIFPTFLYGRENERARTGYRPDFGGEIEGEIETDGLGLMAHDMGYRCWGMPHLEVLHRRK